MSRRALPRIVLGMLRAALVPLLGTTVLVLGLPSISLATSPASSPPPTQESRNGRADASRPPTGRGESGAPAPKSVPSPTNEPTVKAAAASSGSSIVLPVSATVSTAVTSKSALNSLGYALQSPNSIVVCTSCVGGEQTALGKFAGGTELVFSMADNTCARTFLSTDSTHARVTAVSGSQWTIGWDDAGAGCTPDGDFNDLITSVTLAGPAVPAPQVLGPCDGGTDAVNPTACPSEPVNTATGNYVSSVTDAFLPGIGLPFAFTRTYNSADPTAGPLGPGWTHAYNTSLGVQPNGDVTLRSGTGQQVAFALQPDGSYRGSIGARDTLVKLTGGYALTRHDQVRYEFDLSGHPTQISDRNKNKISLAYDASGLLSSLTDTVGRVVSLTYNASNLLTKLSLPDGRSASYSYTSGRLTSVTDLRGDITTYAYDAAGRLSTITDPNGHTVVQNTYGSDGRVTQQVDGLGSRTTFSWDATNQIATVTDARGNQWKDQYASNILIRRIDPLGDVTAFGYDDDLNLARITDPNGNATISTYDARANVLTRTDPLGNRSSFTYDPQNNVTGATDARGNLTAFTYDAAGNLTSMTRPGSNLTSYGRDPAGTGLLTSITDPRGKTTSFGYDASGDLTSITEPRGNKTTMGYDAAGRMTSLVDPRGNLTGANPANFTWTFTYDASNHMLSRTDPIGDKTVFAYDGLGNLTGRTDAKTHATTYGYDADNRLTSVTAPDGSKTTYGYDVVGNLTGRTDANNHTTTFSYDAANRIKGTTDPLARAWQYNHDPAGNLAKVVVPGGGSMTYAHDAANRLTGITYSDSTPNVSFGYDANGNRTSMSDGAGSVTYTFDALNRPTGATRTACPTCTPDAFSYSYDAAGNITTRTYPDGTSITYTYNPINEVTGLTDGGATTSYSYNAAGELSKVTLPATNGYVEDPSWDRAGRLTKLINSKGTTILSSFDYSLDAVGNPTKIVSPNETITYSYDALDRLTKACYTSTCTGTTGTPFISYTYDPVGNRLSEGRASGSTTYTYDAADELTSKTGPGGTTAYTYDAQGNQTAAGASTFSYNLANQLTSATVAGTTDSYTYDGDGNRLKDSPSTGSSTGYLWDTSSAPPTLAIERDQTGAQLRRYAYGDGLVSMTSGGSAFYYLHDGLGLAGLTTSSGWGLQPADMPLGSVANLTSSAGATEWSYAYEPFGAERTTTKVDPGAPANLMGFDAQLIDPPTGLFALRARMYAPADGRFLQLDPVGELLSDPYASSYAYARNRPTILIDPTGQNPGPVYIPMPSATPQAPPVPGGQVPSVGEIATRIAGCVIGAGYGSQAGEQILAYWGLGPLGKVSGAIVGCAAGFFLPPTPP